MCNLAWLQEPRNQDNLATWWSKLATNKIEEKIPCLNTSVYTNWRYSLNTKWELLTEENWIQDHELRRGVHYVGNKKNKSVVDGTLAEMEKDDFWP